MHDGDGFVNVVTCLPDVLQDSRLQASRVGIVLFLAAIRVGALEKLFGAMEASAPRQLRVNRRVVARAFAVINRSRLDFVNGVVDFVNCGFLFGM